MVSFFCLWNALKKFGLGSPLYSNLVSAYRMFGCGRLLHRKPLRIQALTLVAVLLAAVVTGALVPTAVYGTMLANERNEVELSSKRLCSLLAEVDEIWVEMMRLQVKQRVKIGSTSNSSVGPNYMSIDRVIDDPPNDDAARSLFYELAYELEMSEFRV